MLHICRTCSHAIPHPEDYQGDDRDMACPYFGMGKETDSCGDWEAIERGRMKIIVEKRSDAYMAFVEGHKELWDCGSSVPSAIGKLVMTHELIRVEYDLYDK
jgi:hypothetical protein